MDLRKCVLTIRFTRGYGKLKYTKSSTVSKFSFAKNSSKISLHDLPPIFPMMYDDKIYFQHLALFVNYDSEHQDIWDSQNFWDLKFPKNTIRTIFVSVAPSPVGYGKFVKPHQKCYWPHCLARKHEAMSVKLSRWHLTFLDLCWATEPAMRGWGGRSKSFGLK